MEHMNFNDFLSTLTMEQKNAVLSCKTEEELEQVIDDYDIEIPDEMLVGVAGGKGKILSFLAAGIIAFSGAAAVAVSVPAMPAKAYSEQYDIEDTLARLNQSIADLDLQMESLLHPGDPQLLKDFKVSFYGMSIELGKIAVIQAESRTTLTVKPLDMSVLSDIESAIRQANIADNISNNGEMIMVEFYPKQTSDLLKAIEEIKEQKAELIREIEEQTSESNKEEAFIAETEAEFQKCIDDLNGQFKALTQGPDEAYFDLCDKVTVEYEGETKNLLYFTSVSHDSSTITIVPEFWVKSRSILPKIEEAIRQAGCFYCKINNDGEKLILDFSGKLSRSKHEILSEMGLETYRSIDAVVMKAEDAAKEQGMSDETITKIYEVASSYAKEVEKLIEKKERCFWF